MKDQIFTVFVSSTINDLETYRAKLLDILRKKHYLVLCQEDFPPEANVATPQLLEEYIINSDILIMIIGNSYGSLYKQDNKSYVSIEYDLATKNNIPILPLIHLKPLTIDDVGNEQVILQKKFIDKVESERLSLKFRNNEEFVDASHRTVENILKYMSEKSGYTKSSICSKNKRKLELEVLQNKKVISKLEGKINSLENIIRINSELVDATLATRYIYDTANLPQKDVKFMIENIHKEDDDLRKLINEIAANCSDKPLLIDLAVVKLNEFRKELHELIDKSAGYSHHSDKELAFIISALFSPSLLKLKATAVQYKEYKSYWSNDKFGLMFLEQNKAFLKNGGEVYRIFICDSLSQSVSEQWLSAKIVEQLKLGAKIKVIERSQREMDNMDDYGIYTHFINKGDETSYIFLATSDNNNKNIFSPKLLSYDVISYEKNFDSLWKEGGSVLSLLSPKHNSVDFDGESESLTVQELFGKQIILRSMVHLGLKTKIIDAGSGFVRKYNLGYAKGIYRYILNNYSIENICYVGDTFRNDGALVRNLQKEFRSSNVNVYGFICEPQLNISNLWYSDMLYTDKWSDILVFLDKISTKVTKSTLFIFDIDQTIWAAKGVNDEPLTTARVGAINSLIDKYVSSPISRSHMKAVAGDVYNEICKIEYHQLTLDNEDYKAAITLCVSLGAFTGKAGHQKNFIDPDGYSPEQIVWDIKDSLKPYFVDKGINEFLLDVFGRIIRKEFAEEFSRLGGNRDLLDDDIRLLFNNITDNHPAPFTIFREYELSEALKITCSEKTCDINSSLTLNRVTCELAGYLKSKGIKLLALSDRPDEATYNDAANLSLLNTKMALHGESIIKFLPDILHL